MEMVTASGKMQSVDHRMANRVRVRVMVIRLGSPLGLWFGLGFCQHPHTHPLNVPQICNPHVTHGPWLYGMMLAVRTYRRIHTC